MDVDNAESVRTDKGAGNKGNAAGADIPAENGGTSPPTTDPLEQKELEQIQSSVRRLREQRFMVEKLKKESMEKDLRIESLEAKVQQLSIASVSFRADGLPAQDKTPKPSVLTTPAATPNVHERPLSQRSIGAVSYTHLRAHET